MKFTIKREVLLKPLQQVASVVERRQTLPVLSNVLMEVSDGRLAMTGTDLELEMVASLPLQGDVEEGEVTVPARKLLDICKSLPAESDIRFEQVGEQIKFDCTHTKINITLSTLPANEFPSLDEETSGIQFDLEPGLLRELIDRTAFSMAQQDVRYYLNGMLFELRGDEHILRTVATDGHRLALCDVNAESVPAEQIQVILPRKGVLELARIVSDIEKPVSLTIGRNHMRVVAGELTFTSKLVDGKFPDYDRVVPKNSDRLLTADRDTLRQSFSRVAILANEKYRGVRLQIDEGSLRIQANNPEQEQAEEELAVDYNNQPMEIGFNVSYLLDVLNTIEGASVQIGLGDSNSSALIKDPAADNAIYVVMPMRL